MIKIFIELLEFLRSVAPLLFSLGFFALFFVLLAKSIKKHAVIYYTVFAIPFLLYLITFFGGLMGVKTPSFITIPVLGEIIRDYIHVGSLAHPMLIIIMYVGALNVKIPFVKKLMSIRKEISIISGFPVLTHSIVRTMGNFPNSLKYFTNNAEYMETARFTNELGLGISNFSFVMGILLVILFVPLWVTSFDWVRKHMNGLQWKKLQRWSYLLYALLFVHAIGIQVGGILNPRVTPRPAIEATAPASGQNGESNSGENRRTEGGRPERQGEQTDRKQPPRNQQVPAGRAPSKGISDIDISRQTKQYIHIVSLTLIYGSYLYLRLRKAKKNAAKKN